jgi:hypothetical protein
VARANLTLRLLPEGLEELGLGSEAGTTLVAPDGSFVFANVPAGNYTIDAPALVNQYLIGNMPIFYTPQVPRPPGITTRGTIGGPVRAALPQLQFSTTTLGIKAYWARTPVSVGARDASNAVVTLRPTITVRGRLVADVDPAQPRAEGQPRFVELETATGNAAHGIARSVYSRDVSAGEFAIEGIVPGLYVFRGDSPPWMIKSVMLNGRDYAHAPLDTSEATDLSGAVITFTNAVPSLAGTARDASGAAVTEAAVIVFPVEPEQWTNYGLNPTRIQTVTTSTSGAFRVRSLPAGDYYVLAVPGARMYAWQEPGFFERAYGSATRMTIAWGEQKTADVRLSDIK